MGPTAPRSMMLTVECARGLKDVQTFGTQDPYVLAYCAPGGSVETAPRTRSAEDGGISPVWADEAALAKQVAQAARDEEEAAAAAKAAAHSRQWFVAFSAHVARFAAFIGWIFFIGLFE